jgi:hypothetical protein
MDAIRSSETSVLTRATRRNIPEYGILHSVLYVSINTHFGESLHSIIYAQYFSRPDDTAARTFPHVVLEDKNALCGIIL